MPTPWINYLTNGTFHTILSQAGGGFSFYKSPQIWRISRYRFFNLPTDRPGPYLYIEDADTGEYWCPTQEPASIRPDKWEAAHGMGYTRFSAEKNGLVAELLFFVGEYENALIWNLKLQNTSHETKGLHLFAYVEFALMEFMREVQWQCYIKHQVSVKYLRDAGALVYKYGVETQPKPDETPLAYLAADIRPDGYDGDRDEFIGSYRSEANPFAIESAGCTNSTVMGGDPCGALQFNLTIKPEEEKTLNVFLGTGMKEEEIKKSIENMRRSSFASKSFNKLREVWDSYLSKFICSVPDKYTERMINIWNPYQVDKNFTYSRNISYYATGTFRGVGFRDSCQDILAKIPFDLEASRAKIRLLLQQQYNDGHVNHYFFPIEGWPPVTTIHSDDHLWPIWAVWSLIMESGDLSFLHETISYYDGDEATVYKHLHRSIEYTMANMGRNGFPLMLHSDWNDALFKVCREGMGESIWTSMQFAVMLKKIAELAQLLGYSEDVSLFNTLLKKQKDLVNSKGWDGKWFRRAIMDNGDYLGSDIHDQAKVWLNAQTWAVISGLADENKAFAAMDAVRDILDTSLGIKKVHPAITTFPDPIDPLTHYNPGTGENGAVFCHANTWAIIAECILGRGEYAYKYYRQLIPAVAMEKAGIWRYKAEPYVYSSNLFGPESDKFGLANVSWLTGTAAWMYIAATQYILGIKPGFAGLTVDPCVPADWHEFEVTREFRGCKYHFKIYNHKGINKGVKSVVIDGISAGGNFIPHLEGRKMCSIEVTMGCR